MKYTTDNLVNITIEEDTLELYSDRIEYQAITTMDDGKVFKFNRSVGIDDEYWLVEELNDAIEVGEVEEATQ